MAKVITQVGRCRLRRKPNCFASLAESIVHQQLSLAAGQTIYKRVVALCNGRTLHPDSIAPLSDQQLRDAGLSWSKVAYLRDLAARLTDRRLRLRRLPNLTDDEVVAALTEVKGIGQWSAEMYLIFVLNRPDVFSPGDVGLQRAVKRLYGCNVHAARLKKVITRWQPYRSVASWYLWASLTETIE